MQAKQQENKQGIPTGMHERAQIHETAQMRETAQIRERSQIQRLASAQQSAPQQFEPRQSAAQQPALQQPVAHYAAPQQPSSKECPVCHARCFSDMDVCYGCLYQFPSAANNRYTPGASGSAFEAVHQASVPEAQVSVPEPTNHAHYQEIHKACLSPQVHAASEQPTATFKKALPPEDNNMHSYSSTSTVAPQSEISSASLAASTSKTAVQDFQTVKEIPLFENNSLEMRIVIQVRQNGRQNGQEQ